MADIELRGKYAHGRCVVVDDVDAALVDGWCWYCMPEDYARTHMVLGGRRRSISMHRFLLGVLDRPELQVDHINRDRLDNRRENLRAVPSIINRQNTGSQGGSSQFRGVYWDTRKRRWRARVMLNGRKYGLGHFVDEYAAGLAVERFRAECMPHVAPDAALRSRRTPSAA